MSDAPHAGRISRRSCYRQSCEPSGHLISAVQPAWHRAHARISVGRQHWSVHNTSAWRRRGSCLVLLILTPAGGQNPGLEAVS